MTIPSERKRVMQICWVVPDIDAAMKAWVDTMGIGPFFVFRNLKIDTVKHRSKQTSVEMSIAMAQAGGVQIELAQQHSEAPYAYTEMFRGQESGMHHIAIYVGDYDAAMAHFAGKDFETSVEGLFGDLRFAYVDTRPTLGCMTEVIEHNPVQDQIFLRVARAAEDWDGVTDPIRSGFD